MENNKDYKYFNFPICVINKFMENSEECLNNIFDYCIYSKYIKETGNSKNDKIKAIEEFYSIEIKNFDLSIKNGKILFDSIPTKSPITGLKVELFNNFINNNKTDKEKIELLAFLALKSIIGGKTTCKTNNKLLLARMDGQNSINDFSELSNSIQKYSKPYTINIIKNSLIDNWHLTYYSKKTRGFYFSFDVKEIDLLKQVILKNNKFKEKKRKAESKILREKIEHELLNN